MCNFCDVTKNKYERPIQYESKLKLTTDDISTFIETHNGKAYLTEYLYEGEDDSDIINIWAAEINYCPMCGRKLDEIRGQNV